jgi:tetratricopeptide (TPR) repeat protein
MGRIEDLEEAIRTARRAVAVTPDDHPDLAGRLNNLGNDLENRFERTGRIEDLEEAIRTARRAVAVTSDDHPDLAGRLNNLGSKFGSRFKRTGQIEDLEEAIRTARRAVAVTPDDHPWRDIVQMSGRVLVCAIAPRPTKSGIARPHQNLGGGPEKIEKTAAKSTNLGL